MNEKLNKLRNTRKSIIADYSSKPILNTALENISDEIQHVIVSEIISENADTKSFILIPNKDAGTKRLFPFKPGEYISVFASIHDKILSRPYFISSSINDLEKNFYRITIKRENDGIVSNYFHDNIKVGDLLEITLPTGDFSYSTISDEKNILALACDKGIIPFISLANSIKNDISLTVFYSVKEASDIIFKKEIEKINAKKKNVHFVITLTEEENSLYQNGEISALMIEPYKKEFNTVLMCGKNDFYKSMNKVLNDLQIAKKNVHYEILDVDYKTKIKEEYLLKIISRNKEITIPCYSNETLLRAMEESGIKAPSRCQVGECGFCRSILVSGKIKMVGGKMLQAENNYDYIHPCISYPESDIVIKLDI